ncbi:MAG TPA: DUF559 domain-containing protein [Allosphingosinicella sp.]|jgi:very-short-patch-repair endonuclease
MRDPRLVAFARLMRREMTAPEKRLWLQLRAKRLCGAKFRRQNVIGRYIADFSCRTPMLVIEVDGESHACTLDIDEVRTAYFAERGYRVLRFTNAEGMANLEGVLDAIALLLDSPSPQPSPLQGRGSCAAA